MGRYSQISYNDYSVVLTEVKSTWNGVVDWLLSDECRGHYSFIYTDINVLEAVAFDTPESAVLFKLKFT